jgi:hypothetical protein
VVAELHTVTTTPRFSFDVLAASIRPRCARRSLPPHKKGLEEDAVVRLHRGHTSVEWVQSSFFMPGSAGREKHNLRCNRLHAIDTGCRPRRPKTTTHLHRFHYFHSRQEPSSSSAALTSTWLVLGRHVDMGGQVVRLHPRTFRCRAVIFFLVFGFSPQPRPSGDSAAHGLGKQVGRTSFVRAFS